MTGRIIKKWMSLLLAVTMLISMASLNVSASETDKTYQAYDASKHRKVISKNGTTDSEWSLCMDHHKKTPGETDKATGEYSKNENATKDTYTSNGGKGDFQKIKRMLFYKLTHPELNYQVLQNEYYYQQDNKTNKNYDTNYRRNLQLNKQKKDLRAFAEDSSHDDEINSKMEVFIYKAKNPLMQNLISAKLKELPPPTPLEPAKTSLKVEKKWQGIDSKDAPEITVYLVKNGIKTDQSIKLNNGNNWKGEFKDLKVVDNITDKKANIYTIVESGEKDGKVVLEGKEYKVTYAGGKVVNTKEVPPPSTPPTKVKFSKKALTENGEELKGATIRLTKEDGSLVKEWVTDGTVKEFELKDGKYTFTEISAPAKYQVATAITFEVKNGKAIVKGIEVTGNTIVMVDKLKELPPPNTNTNKTLPKTGEGTNISLYAWLMLTSGTLLVLIGYRRRNHAK
ncbi:hypothetical protein SCI_1273 [Streptococcus constellatus subsp. pharyngis C1050]|uniref:SpaA isopeptide-forming pilin-related protein n=1 Tax=Streptococcus constellatus TaxID=76860 RepID=UPI0003908E7E|nr:SpaA isopeptide-forming pilin-related protein [Streptococcus constellatus]AGU80202.1 hypothetical protein SCI_1273 [Streptococcus constellatus subsp. pharyngis C1050]